MHNRFLVAGSLLAGFAVAIGAFGSHGLEKLTQDVTIINGYRTAVQYQFYHAFALLILGVLAKQGSYNKWMKWAGNLFIAGILFFSGSIYLLTFLKIANSAAIRVVGPLTAVGGLLLIAGWVCFFNSLLYKQSNR